MLTQISYFGYTFNPVTFYFCFDDSGERVTDIVAEITNTPWGERHTYVLTADKSRTFEFEKQFHVSPFLDMNYRYRWVFSNPDRNLTIHMENHPTGTRGKPDFDATLTLDKKDWSKVAVGQAILRQPFMTFVTLVLIYFHAAVIWLKRIPFVAHPKSLGQPHPAVPGRATPSIHEGDSP